MIFLPCVWFLLHREPTVCIWHAFGLAIMPGTNCPPPWSCHLPRQGQAPAPSQFSSSCTCHVIPRLPRAADGTCCCGTCDRREPGVCSCTEPARFAVPFSPPHWAALMCGSSFTGLVGPLPLVAQACCCFSQSKAARGASLPSPFLHHFFSPEVLSGFWHRHGTCS